MSTLDYFEKRLIVVLCSVLFLIFIFPGQLIYNAHIQSSFDKQCSDVFLRVDSIAQGLDESKSNSEFISSAYDFTSSILSNSPQNFGCFRSGLAQLDEDSLLRVYGFQNNVLYWESQIKRGLSLERPVFHSYPQRVGIKVERICYGYSLWKLESPHCVVYVG